MINGVPDVRIPRVKPGDPVKAADYNAMAEAVERLLAAVADLTQGYRGARLVFGELIDDDIEDREVNKKAAVMAFDTSAGSTDDKWKKNTALEKNFICDPQDGIYLEGERHLFLWLGGSGKFIPIPGLNMQIGRLDATLTQGSSATVSVWEWNEGGGAFADSTVNHTAYDWMLGSGESLEALTRVVLIQHLQSRKYLVIAAACAPDAS